jgi:hypothetical protein
VEPLLLLQLVRELVFQGLKTIRRHFVAIEWSRNLGKFSAQLQLGAIVRVARWFVFKPKTRFGSIVEGLAMEKMYILRPFGLFLVICYFFPRFGILYHEKSGNPGLRLIFWCFLQTIILLYDSLVATAF